MERLMAVADWLLPLLYLALLVDYATTFFLRARPRGRGPWLAGVVVAHAAFLVLRAVHLGYVPAFTNAEVLSLVAVATAAVYGVVEYATHERRTGVFVLLAVFLFQYTSSVFVAGSTAHPGAYGAGGGLARLHIVPAVLAYTAVTLAAVYGTLHLLARRGLKEHSIGVLFDRLPPLDLLGRMTWLALIVGLVCMTVVIATSPMLVGQADASRAKVVVKAVVGSLAWLVYAAGVVGKLSGRWPPSRVSAAAVAGFLAVMAMLGASIALS